MASGEFIPGLWALLWLAATLAAFVLMVRRVAASRMPQPRRWLTALACIAAWLGLQFCAFIGTFMLVYCENCSGRPFSARDFLALSVWSAPTALALLVLLLLRKKR